MSRASRDKQAQKAITEALAAMFGSASIDKIVMGPTEGPDGEPALFVTVYLKPAQQQISGSQLLDAIAVAATTLREFDDDRFPYVTFLAPEDEPAEDTRPAA